MCRDVIVFTKRSFSKICVRNHQKFQNLCVKSSKVCVRNHQDNYFLINVTCCQFQVVEDDLKLFCDVYNMLCHVSDPNLGLIAFILNEQLTQVIYEMSTVSRSDDIFVIVLG